MKKEIIKPFDLEKAKAGAKLRTRRGEPVEIFKWDARGGYPIKGMIIEKYDDKSGSLKLNGSWGILPYDSDLVIVEEVEEPEFKDGDWVVNKFGDVWRIDSFDKKNYQVSDEKGNYNYFPISKQDEMRLWTIDDAKAGDVLVASDGSIFIFASVVDCACKHYVALETDGAININEGLKHYYETSEAAHPATKEQRELLFSKLKEAGYEWNAKKLKLKKIKPKFWSDDVNIFNGFYINSSAHISKIYGASNIRSNYNVFVTKKQAKSALAMARISQIMANDIENFGGVITDEEWLNDEPKFVIDRYDNRINTTSIMRNGYDFLAFHTAEQRDLFLEKYPQLVKDYLMISDEED